MPESYAAVLRGAISAYGRSLINELPRRSWTLHVELAGKSISHSAAVTLQYSCNARWRSLLFGCVWNLRLLDHALEIEPFS